MEINKLNYEAFALEYLEGTLSSEEMKAMEQFLLKNPAIQSELEEMKDFLVLTPEPVVFANKKQLLKIPAKDRVVWMNPKRWSIAASIILLVAFMFYPNDRTIDTIATIPKKQNTLEKDETKLVPSNQKDKNKEVSTTIDQLVVEHVTNQTEDLNHKEPIQQKIKEKTVVTNKIKEAIADYNEPIQRNVNDQLAKVVELQEIDNQLAANQPLRSEDQQRETIKIDLLETKNIALLKVPMELDMNAINSISATNNLIAKAETPKKRTFKSLIGKLPGTAKGVKISIIPSFFTD